MTLPAPENKNDFPPRLGRAWDRYRVPLIIAAVLLSLLLHVGSYKTLGKFHGADQTRLHHKQKSPIKVRIIENPKNKKRDTKDKPDAKRIVEAQQSPTTPPKKPDFLGSVDHSAEKNTRLPNKISQDKAKNPGEQGNQGPSTKKVVAQKRTPQAPPKEEPAVKQKEPRLESGFGNIAVLQNKKKPRNHYESLLPSQATDLAGQVNAGYQDHLSDDIPLGDRVDLNTSEYRYIGYFTSMRKAIELVWNYPPEASRRGLQGEVSLEFAIGKDGRTSHIRVLKSSGYEVLDHAIIDAIKLASPFAPLPPGFGKNKLVITGSFRYILGPYAAH